MAVEILDPLQGELEIHENQPITNFSSELDLYTDTFSVVDTNELLDLLLASVSGEVNVESTRIMAKNIDGSNINGSLQIRQRLFDNMSFELDLQENTPVWASIQGTLDIYEGTIAPTIYSTYSNTIDLETGVRQVGIEVRMNNVDISHELSAVKVSYSISKYVGELNLTFKNWEMYADMHPLNHWGNLVFEVYADGTFVGSFFLEKRTSKATFKDTQLTVWGRSKPALLSTPFCTPISTIWNDETTALAIVNEVMADYSDVILEWRIMDYDILGGKVSADNRTPIEVISDLAAPVGGILYTNFAGDVIVDYKWVDLDLG